MRQKIKKVASADGTNIAYAISGKGPVLVKTATYITHLKHDWESPTWKPLLTGLSNYHTLLRYDERGCGLSDWYTRDYSWESWVEDLKAVVDAENIESFDLYGQSQGATVAVAFAAKYPERVRKLIILGGYARGWLHRNLEPIQKKEEQLIIELIRLGWGKENPAFRNFFAAQIMPTADSKTLRAFNELMKISTEPEIAAILEREMHLSNVIEEAPNVSCPTLILHAVEDASVPFKEGKILASLIPNSRLVRLDSVNHIIQEHEPAWKVLWNEIYSFLEVPENLSQYPGIRRERVRRVIRTILITDIVDSTKVALKLGDKKWIELLEIHSKTVNNSTHAFSGEIIKDTGDGFVMTFESASSALECAQNLVQQFNEYPLDIRCGIHAGEIEQVAGDIRGIQVHMASRITNYAGSNEIWMSGIVKELIKGSSIAVMEMGEYDLKGIPEPMLLYRLETN